MTNIAFLSTAHTHTKSFLSDVAKRDDCQVSVIWDDMESRGQNFADEYDAEFLNDLDAVISSDDIDGFIICAENTRHLPLLRAAIPAGKSIFCEKPFTSSAEHAAEAMALIREHNTIVHMGYMQPFTDVMQGVARLLSEGTLGNLTHARCRVAHHAAYGHWFDSPELAWFHDPELAGGGAFMDMGTHAVHLVRSLFGPVVRAFARIVNVSGIYSSVDDSGIALLQFESGLLCTVEAAWVQTGGFSGLEITGSEATLYSDPALGMAYNSPGKEPKVVELGEERPSRVERLLASIRGTISREELDADLVCAADAVAIMDACYESSRSERWVEVQKV